MTQTLRKKIETIIKGKLSYLAWNDEKYQKEFADAIFSAFRACVPEEEKIVNIVQLKLEGVEDLRSWAQGFNACVKGILKKMEER